MIALSRDIPCSAHGGRPIRSGEPDAILLVEFAGDDPHDNRAGSRSSRSSWPTRLRLCPSGVIEATDPALQREVWEVRKAGLNIMMSMKGDGKPCRSSRIVRCRSST